MANPLQSVLRGAKYPLSQQSDDDDQAATGNAVSGSDSGPIAKPSAQVAAPPAPKPAPKPAPEQIQTANEPEKSADVSQADPKRIQFSSGIVLEIPGDWKPEAVTEFARAVYAASQKAEAARESKKLETKPNKDMK